MKKKIKLKQLDPKTFNLLITISFTVVLIASIWSLIYNWSILILPQKVSSMAFIFFYGVIIYFVFGQYLMMKTAPEIDEDKLEQSIQEHF